MIVRREETRSAGHVDDCEGIRSVGRTDEYHKEKRAERNLIHCGKCGTRNREKNEDKLRRAL